MSGNLPRSFVGTFPLNQDLQQAHTTRQSDLLYIPRYSSKYAQKLPEYLLPKIWNNGQDRSLKIRLEISLKIQRNLNYLCPTQKM